MNRSVVFLACLGLGLLTSSLAAQAALAGPGSVSLPTIDTTALSGGGAQNLGVQYLPATNTIFVTGRGNTLGGAFVGTPPHSIYEFDITGTTLLNTYQQTTTSPLWGHRDGATDGVLLFFGDEGGISCFNPATGMYETNPTILTAGGPVIPATSYPLPLTVPLGTNRALAYNPAGNGGAGSFWSADFGSALLEIDLDGVVINNFPNASAWSLYGLAYDPIRNMLWGSTSPNAGNLVEIDPATGTETGNSFTREVGGAQGGLSFMQRPGGPFSELLVLTQGAPDAIVAQRLDLLDPAPGATGNGYYEEAELVSGTGPVGVVTNSLLKTFIDGDFLNWGFGARVGGSGVAAGPYLVLSALGPDAATVASTFGVPELVVPNNFSNPASVGLTYTLEDGFGFGGLLAPNALLGPGIGAIGGPPVSFGPWPAGTFLGGEAIRLQAYFVDFGIAYGGANPGYSTNTIDFVYVAPSCTSEGFEGLPAGLGNYPAGWVNGPGGTVGDEWRPGGPGGTPSGSTGASGPNTGSGYMFIETSGAANTWPKTFVMDSAPLAACPINPMLSFSYHMLGGTMGTLTIEDLDAMGNPISTLFTISGAQGANWVTMTVPVTPDANGNVTLRITGMTPAANNSWQSDICIDDFAMQ
ncbi:MAG: hypothetical protein CMJ83_19915 [Planctomycetes bacterium]|nr:hypothetical protein [Planctomycetota bacterium]